MRKIVKRCKVIVEGSLYKECVIALQEEIDSSNLIFQDDDDKYLSAEVATIIAAGFTTFATIISALIVAKGTASNSVIKITTKDYSVELSGSDSLNKIEEIIQKLDKADSASIKIK